MERYKVVLEMPVNSVISSTVYCLVLYNDFSKIEYDEKVNKQIEAQQQANYSFHVALLLNRLRISAQVSLRMMMSMTYRATAIASSAMVKSTL